MTQFKDKSKHLKFYQYGSFGYPVLMASDILIYKTNYVPVGEDQKQHVELARTISRKFNNKFGKTFTVPECLIQKNTARIMSLTDPTQKMAKSVPHSFLTLNDSSAIIKDKIKKAVTDSRKRDRIFYLKNQLLLI